MGRNPEGWASKRERERLRKSETANGVKKRESEREREKGNEAQKGEDRRAARERRKGVKNNESSEVA